MEYELGLMEYELGVGGAEGTAEFYGEILSAELRDRRRRHLLTKIWLGLRVAAFRFPEDQSRL